MLSDQKPNYWIMLGLYFVAIGVILLRTNSPIDIGGFMFGHYLLNYEEEFLKRGFIGEIFRLTTNEPNYATFKLFAKQTFCLLFFSFTSFFGWFLAKNRKQTGAWLYILIFLTGSFSLQHFYQDAGRFDHLLFLLMLLSLFLINRSIKLFWILSPVMLLLPLLIHEAALLITIPFILSYALYKHPKKISLIIILLLLVLSLLSATLISTHGNLTKRTLHEHYELLQKKHPERIGGLGVVSKKTLSDEIRSSFQRLKQPRTLLSHIKLSFYLLPLALLFIPFLRSDFIKNSFRLRHLLILSSFSPLALYPIAFDFYRWWSLALTLWMLSMLLISFEENEFREALFNHLTNHKKLVFSVVVFSISFGAMCVSIPAFTWI